MEETFTITRTDGQQLAGYKWSVERPRSALVLSHGMGEHARRYRASLAALIESGVAVYAIDQRGHGATIALSGREAGDYGPGGFDAVVADLTALVARARADLPGAPVFLLGHSMGSFIGQAFLIDYGRQIDGAVLVGTTAVDMLAQAMARESDVMAALNRPFEPARTPSDWLSRSQAEVDAYIADPLCGFSLEPVSMVSLLSQGERLANPAELAKIPSDLPLYILVGGRDSLTTEFGKLEPMIERYRAAGLDPVLALYPEGRHEILNETNRDEVVGDLLGWLNNAFERVRPRTSA